VNRRERRAKQYAERREIFLALEAALDANAILVVDEILQRHKIALCPCCLAHPVFEKHPDGSPVEDRGQRVRIQDDTATFWICETCAVSYAAYARSRAQAVPFNYNLWLAREEIEVRRREVMQDIRERLGARST